MAIKAGRVGVREDQVDPYGRIISSGPSLVDSEEIVFDEGAGGTKAYLAQEVSNKIAKALQTPAQAPASDKLVGIDTAGAQAAIGIGEGLSLEAGVLKAAGGGIFVKEFEFNQESAGEVPVIEYIDVTVSGYTPIGLRFYDGYSSNSRWSFELQSTNDNVHKVRKYAFAKNGSYISLRFSKLYVYYVPTSSITPLT